MVFIDSLKNFAQIPQASIAEPIFIINLPKDCKILFPILSKASLAPAIDEPSASAKVVIVSVINAAKSLLIAFAVFAHDFSKSVVSVSVFIVNTIPCSAAHF